MPASSTFTISGPPGSVFVFQINGAFTMGASAAISLTGGVTADTVFWYTLGAPSLGADCDFSVRPLPLSLAHLNTNTLWVVGSRTLGSGYHDRSALDRSRSVLLERSSHARCERPDLQCNRSSMSWRSVARRWAGGSRGRGYFDAVHYFGRH
jgi:hypothetical protein